MNKLTKVKIQLNELDIIELKLVRIWDCWKSSCPILTSGKKFAQQVSTFSLKLESDQSGKLVFFFSSVHYLQFPNTIQGQGKVRGRSDEG